LIALEVVDEVLGGEGENLGLPAPERGHDHGVAVAQGRVDPMLVV